ncbi:MAG: hypothetical protein PF450_17005 [Bacteroidales bacterium]|jgi:hypothetical protein|nr:hypothetical protein [Bacteroidales bacterium]
MDNLIDGLLKQIDRCTELKKIYDEIPLGAFGAMFIQKAIDEGRKALTGGDVIEQLRCYKELESCE